MIFSSVDFFIFFAAFLLLYRVLPHRPQNLLILFGSYIFYSWWDWRFTFLIVLMSLVDAIAAIEIGKTEKVARRKAWVAASFTVNLGVLGFFKYFNFFIDTAANVLHTMGFEPHLTTLRLILPVGVSFFTFQSMSYVLDVYRKQTPVVSIYNHMLFVAYFPLLLAGPIERHRHLTQQLMRPRVMTAEGMLRGVILLLWGLFKKVALADNLAPYVNAVYTNVGVHNGASVALATYLFAIQIYCDFSGYSDMAVGMGRMMGIDVMFNFRSPYLAQNVQEFWRRWHISLSTWFRDYLYLPLGGSKVSKPRELLNILIVFVVSGFWHGASWAFVIWGALHGTYMVIWRLLPRAPKPGPIRRWVNVLITFHAVVFAWIFFRAGGLPNALAVLKALGRPGKLFFDPMLVNAALPLALVGIIEIWKDPVHLDEWLVWKPGAVTLGLGLLVATLVLLFAAQSGLQFIYFQF